MSPRSRFNIKMFAGTVFRGAMGIASEIILVFSVILVGLAVGLIWWGIFR